MAYSPSPPTAEDGWPGRGVNQPSSRHSAFAPEPSPLSPVTATTTPMTETASSMPTLRNSMPSLSRVVSRVDRMLRATTAAKQTTAVSLLAQTAAASGLAESAGLAASARNEPSSTRLTYSPEMMATIAALPGLSTITAVHKNRKLAISPKQCRR